MCFAAEIQINCSCNRRVSKCWSHICVQIDITDDQIQFNPTFTNGNYSFRFIHSAHRFFSSLKILPVTKMFKLLSSSFFRFSFFCGRCLLLFFIFSPVNALITILISFFVLTHRWIAFVFDCYSCVPVDRYCGNDFLNLRWY